MARRQDATMVGNDCELTESRRLSMLNLAPELRNTIFRHALTSEEDCIDLTAGNIGDSAFALLGVSAGIRHEATPIFFGLNTFQIDCTDIDRVQLLIRLRKLPSRHMDMIRKYRFLYHYQDQERLEEDIRGAPTRSVGSQCKDPTVIDLHILPNAPFQTFEKVHGSFSEPWDAFHLAKYFVEDMFSYRRVRPLAVMDVADIACFVDRCGYAQTMNLRQRTGWHSTS